MSQRGFQKIQSHCIGWYDSCNGQVVCLSHHPKLIKMSIAKRKRHYQEGTKGMATNQPMAASEDYSPSCGWQYLQKDLLNYVLSFFFSNDSNDVDESSILSAMLVSKHWKDAATSTSLWQIPQQGPVQLSVENAFNINLSSELYCSGASTDDTAVRRPSSFLGFVKLDSAKCKLVENDMTVYRAMERSSRQIFLFCVAPRHSRSKEVLHYIFFAGADLDNRRPIYIMGSNCQRIVLVYHDLPLQPSGPVDFQSQADLLIRQCLHTPRPLYMREVLYRLSVRHQTSNHPVSTAHWAIIVDWIFEVATCFEIGLHAVFSAMELFRRFVDCYWDGTVSEIIPGCQSRVITLHISGLTTCWGCPSSRFFVGKSSSAFKISMLGQCVFAVSQQVTFSDNNLRHT